MASTLSQLGILRSLIGRPEEAVRAHVQALMINYQLGSSSGVNVKKLIELRSMLGNECFARIVLELMSDGDASTLYQLLAQA
jgi:hypothetical protein